MTIGYRVDRRLQLGRLHLRLEWRLRSSSMGRFGGGWNWHLGVQFGGRTLMVFLLVLMVRAHWERPA